MAIPLLLQRLTATPWAIDARAMPMVGSILKRKLEGRSFDGPTLHAEFGIPDLDAQDRRAAANKKRTEARSARVAVIPVYGMIEQRAHSMGASAEEIAANVEAAMASPGVDAILLDIDSPGGTVAGIPEVAARLKAMRKQKPTLALSNSLMASAAYWLGAQMDEVWSTPSGETGSIGVYGLHVDQSQALENEGVKVTTFSAGKYKLEGAPFAPMSEEGADFLQAQVEGMYDWFIRDVASARGVAQKAVREGYGEGRVLGAVQAKAAGMVDEVGTFEQAIERLTKRVAALRRTSATAERERLAI